MMVASMADEQERRRGAAALQGVVRSDKMDKTVVVEVTQRVLHRTYKKYVRGGCATRRTTSATSATSATRCRS